MDKYRDVKSLPLVEERINHIISRLDENLRSGDYNTREQLASDYARYAGRFAKGHDKPLYETPEIVKGSSVSELELAQTTSALHRELLYLFLAIRGTERLAENNFNFAAAWIRKLQSGLKYTRQQLSAFSLYTRNFGDDLFFGETFSNEENIDRGSEFLSVDECSINLSEGTISLPLLEEENEREIKAIDSGALSNGHIGNNVQAGVPLRNNIKTLHDGNVDTWAEYERIVSEEDHIGLVWDLKIALNDNEIINGVKVTPVFLGARTPYQITSLKISEDGKNWIDLKNDVRVVPFLDENIENQYHLSPHTCRFAGEFSISFAPRYARFIKLTIKQASTIQIVDTYGNEHLRYAIALKEVSVHGYKYATAGELISKQIPFTRNISALAIEDLVDPPLLTRSVGRADYFISTDDGGSWDQLSSIDQALNDVPEVLFLGGEVSSVRYKIALSKDESAFSDLVKGSTERPFREIYPVGDRRPFDIPLTHEPIDGSITICEPGIASRGKVHPRTSLGRGVTSSLQIHTDGTSYYRHGNNEHRLPIPFVKIEDFSAIKPYVNNTYWEKTSDFSTHSAWDQVCKIERDSSNEYWELVFGNGSATDPKGAIPAPGDEVSLFLEEEDNYLTGLTSPYKMKLEYPSTGEKEDVILRYYGGLEFRPGLSFPHGETEFDLPSEYLYINPPHKDVWVLVVEDDGESFYWTNTLDADPPVSGPFQTFKTFVNGSSELTSTGDWTVDERNGKVYIESSIPEDEEVLIYCWFQDVTELSLSDWDFVDGSLDEILVYDSGYFSREGSTDIDTLGIKSVDLTFDDSSVEGIVPKSIRIDEGVFGDYSSFEVPFVNGTSEFRGQARVKDEEVPTTTANLDAIASFRLTHWKNIFATGGIYFSDQDTFSTQKENYSSLVDEGDYFFDVNGDHPTLGAGYVHVKLGAPSSTIPEGGTVSYQYLDTSSTERFKGAYSVDSKKGRVYFAEKTESTGTITYRFTPYKVKYEVSRYLEPDKDFEYLENMRAVRLLSAFRTQAGNKVSLQYKYEPEAARAENLAPFFSPLLRGLALRVS